MRNNNLWECEVQNKRFRPKILWKKKENIHNQLLESKRNSNISSSEPIGEIQANCGDAIQIIQPHRKLTKEMIIKLYTDVPHHQIQSTKFPDIFSKELLAPEISKEFILPMSGDEKSPLISNSLQESTHKSHNLHYLPLQKCNRTEKKHFLEDEDGIMEPVLNPISKRGENPLWSNDNNSHDMDLGVKDEFHNKLKSDEENKDKPFSRKLFFLDETNPNNSTEALSTNTESEDIQVYDKIQQELFSSESHNSNIPLPADVIDVASLEAQLCRLPSPASEEEKIKSSSLDLEETTLSVQKDKGRLSAQIVEELLYKYNPLCDSVLKINENDKVWYYKDLNNKEWGPFDSVRMNQLYTTKRFFSTLLIRCEGLFAFMHLEDFITTLKAPELYYNSIYSPRSLQIPPIQPSKVGLPIDQGEYSILKKIPRSASFFGSHNPSNFPLTARNVNRDSRFQTIDRNNYSPFSSKTSSNSPTKFHGCNLAEI